MSIFPFTLYVETISGEALNRASLQRKLELEAAETKIIKKYAEEILAQIT